MKRILFEIPLLLAVLLFSLAPTALAADVPANYTVWDRMPAEAAVNVKLKVENATTLYTKQMEALLLALFLAVRLLIKYPAMFSHIQIVMPSEF